MSTWSHRGKNQNRGHFLFFSTGHKEHRRECYHESGGPDSSIQSRRFQLYKSTKLRSTVPGEVPAYRPVYRPFLKNGSPFESNVLLVGLMGMTGRQWWRGVTDITNVSHSGVGWRSSVASPCSAIGRQDSPVHMHRVRMMDNCHKVLCYILYREAENPKGLKACSRTFCDQTVHVFIEYVYHTY